MAIHINDIHDCFPMPDITRLALEVSMHDDDTQQSAEYILSALLDGPKNAVGIRAPVRVLLEHVRQVIRNDKSNTIILAERVCDLENRLMTMEDESDDKMQRAIKMNKDMTVRLDAAYERINELKGSFTPDGSKNAADPMVGVQLGLEAHNHKIFIIKKLADWCGASLGEAKALMEKMLEGRTAGWEMIPRVMNVQNPAYENLFVFENC